MTASAATTIRTKKPNATMTLRRGPADKGKNAKGWREAGFVPADHIFVDFPAEVVPDIAYITTTLRSGDRALMLTMAPDDLTDDLLTGAELVAYERNPRSRIVTRDEAAARFAEWQAKARLRSA